MSNASFAHSIGAEITLSFFNFFYYICLMLPTSLISPDQVPYLRSPVGNSSCYKFYLQLYMKYNCQ